MFNIRVSVARAKFKIINKSTYYHKGVINIFGVCEKHSQFFITSGQGW